MSSAKRLIGGIDRKVIMFSLGIVLLMLPAVVLLMLELWHHSSAMEEIDSRLLAKKESIIAPARGLIDLREDLVYLLEGHDESSEEEEIYEKGKLLIARANKLIDELEQAAENYKDAPEETYYVEELTAQLPILKQTIIKAIEMSHVDTTMANAYLDSANEAFSTFASSMMTLVSLSNRKSRGIIGEIRESSNEHYMIVLYVAAGSILLAILCAIVAGHSISTPISRIARTMQSIAAGDASEDIPYQDRPDEIGELAGAAVTFQGRNQKLREVSDQLEMRNEEVEKQSENLKKQNALVQEKSRELHAALAQEKELALMQRQFVSTMSHEIRTPLNGVLGMADLMLRSNLQDKQRRYMNTLTSSARSLLTIINEILDFSKMESGKLEVSPVEANLRETVKAVNDTFISIAAEKSVAYLVDCRWDMPNIVLHDPERLRQVLVNLVGNALKFTSSGHVLVANFMTQRDDSKLSGRMRFEVSDTGIGMTEEQAAKIFQPFVQADGSTSRKYGGTGLGLAISRQIVELMGGKLEVTSKEGEGSCFSFEIPITYKLDPGYYRKELRMLASSKILVVEAYDKALEVVVENLRSCGLHVDGAGSAKSALKLMLLATAKDDPYDTMLIDQFLSDLSHRHLAKIVRDEQRIETPLLALMSNIQLQSDDDIDGMFDLTVDKPIAPLKMIRLLASARQSQNVAKRKEQSIPGVPQSAAVAFQQATLKAGGATASAPVGGPEPVAHTETQGGNDGPISGARILLVEDDPINQLYAEDLLLEFGCIVTKATNGKEAINRLKNIQFDIILMDCMMPVMDGLEATGIIRRAMSAGKLTRIPIIALTANAAEKDKQKCFDAGMDDYLSKPFDGDSLANVVQIWLERGVTNDDMPAGATALAADPVFEQPAPQAPTPARPATQAPTPAQPAPQAPTPARPASQAPTPAQPAPQAPTPAQPAAQAAAAATTASPIIQSTAPQAAEPAAAPPIVQPAEPEPAAAAAPSDASGGDGGDEPVVDWDTYGKTRAAMSKRFDDLVAGFLESTAGYVGDIGKAFKDGDAKVIALKAHTIKSSARLVGATKLSKAAEALEHASKALGDNMAETPKLSARIAPLQGLYDQTRDALRAAPAA